jgi:diguanylate cyclase (GGDEF)-like protein
MTTRDTETTPTEAARESAAYLARMRRASEQVALAAALLFAITGVLPVTPEEHRSGVLWAAAALVALTLIWFHIVPSERLGDRRVVVFGVSLQPVFILLLGLTGGNNSPYFPYFLLPVLVTAYAPRIRDTVVLGAVAAASLVVIALLARGADTALVVIGRLTTNLVELLVFVVFTAFAGRALRDARRAITDRAELLAVEREDAVRLAYTDTLTGLHNRRYADDLLARLVAEAGRGRPFSVLALDLDGLKVLNDRSGHAAGDRALTRIGEVLRLQLRGADVPIRVSGDEFLAILPGTRVEQARVVGDRLRAAVAAADWSAVGAPVSISCGGAEWHDGQSGADVVKAADAQLYEAKRARAR